MSFRLSTLAVDTALPLCLLPSSAGRYCFGSRLPTYSMRQRRKQALSGALMQSWRQDSTLDNWGAARPVGEVRRRGARFAQGLGACGGGAA